MSRRIVLPLAAAAALLAGCATNQATVERMPRYDAAPSVYVQHGRVTAMESIAGRGSASGAGAVVGGVAGAVIGRQFGGSSGGRDRGTVFGALAGALIGHEIEKDQTGARDRVRITVAVDRGGTRQFEVRDPGGLRVGDRVRIEGDRLIRL
ncbi:MAG TPA: glycine zipper 2TM domain-containing protein [Rubrivivax sp.]|jgi:outer membrane lipoprotein SlyB|nr:glycine zipper 2TM domain-containing protein [Rhodoferax sp.]MCL4738334.1 glycine zipper 2TM domain-containing protein [Burkholderiaceae bacterium]MCP5288928.1 glycine zipper 2TM domain-containing protein [Burkholderiaceae bacterium]HMR69089.1 glycine zipper 2TM domain-containing protein [Rubrivivax sp.]